MPNKFSSTYFLPSFVGHVLVFLGLVVAASLSEPQPKLMGIQAKVTLTEVPKSAVQAPPAPPAPPAPEKKIEKPVEKPPEKKVETPPEKKPEKKVEKPPEKKPEKKVIFSVSESLSVSCSVIRRQEKEPGKSWK